MVNKQGQTRLSKYYNSFSVQERITLEGELIRKCLSRTENQVSQFIDWLINYLTVCVCVCDLVFIFGASTVQSDLQTIRFALLHHRHRHWRGHQRAVPPWVHPQHGRNPRQVLRECLRARCKSYLLQAIVSSLTIFSALDNVQHREGPLYNRWNGDGRIHRGDKQD